MLTSNLFAAARLISRNSSLNLIVTAFVIFAPTNAAVAKVDPAPVVQTAMAGAPAIAQAPESAVVPEWVSAIDSALKPHATNLNYFYVWSDIALFCLAMFIMMGFWGGKFSRAWVLNAVAVVCFIFITNSVIDERGSNRSFVQWH